MGAVRDNYASEVRAFYATGSPYSPQFNPSRTVTRVFSLSLRLTFSYIAYIMHLLVIPILPIHRWSRHYEFRASVNE